MKLSDLKISFDNIVDCKVGLRPYRIGGIRIELEKVGKKTVIHNYGHGGSGISLSWGTVNDAIELFEKSLDVNTFKNKTIAVIGAGVIGLTTAYRLLEKGYDVNIYTEKITPNTTSDVAAAVWGPFAIDIESINKERLFNWQIYSFREFEKFINSKDPQLRGVYFVDTYYEIESASKLHANFAPELVPIKSIKEIEFYNKLKKKFYCYKELFIEMPVYMKDLPELVLSRGAKINICQISAESLQDIQDDIIFNCTGLGSSLLFGDQALLPIRGQLVMIEQTGVHNVIIIQKYNNQNSTFVLFPRHSEFQYIIGLTYEENVKNLEIDETHTKKLLNAAKKFFEGNLK